jgi:hypothetical protein
MGKKHKKAKLPKEVLGVKLPKEVREVGGALLEKANSPQGREMLAAGLTMAAAAATAALAKGRAERAAPARGTGAARAAGVSCPASAAAGDADAARSAGDRRCGGQGGGGDARAAVRSERLTRRGLRGAHCSSDIGTDCMAPGPSTLHPRYCPCSSASDSDQSARLCAPSLRAAETRGWHFRIPPVAATWGR